jgi:hypothetical protein
MEQKGDTATTNPETKKDLKPSVATKRQMKPITREGFHNLLKRSINPPPASNPHSELT